MNYDELEKKANPGAFSTLDMAVLVPEVKKLKPNQVYVEIGVDRGKSLSIARMVTHPEVKICGIDLQENPKVPGTFHVQGDSSLVAQAWGKDKINVLFIDGDHTYKGCKADIDAWYPHMAKKGVMLFHDADATSPGVVQAIEEFAKENKLKVWFSPNQQCSMARIRL